MKKITIALMLFIAAVTSGYSQCIRLNQYPYDTVSSNNIGTVQTITIGAYSTEYSKLTNLTVGGNYQFTCSAEEVNKYITVTDWNNNVLVYGPSPLTVTGITSADILLHYSDDAECTSGFEANLVTIQAILSCPPPSPLTVSGIATNGATVTWTPQGTETSWQTLILLEGSPAPTAATVGSNLATTSLTVSDLVPATNYQFYIRSNCGTEFSPWNGPKNFTTNCLPISTLTESFETTPVDEIPSCWTAIIGGAGVSENASVSVQESSAVSGTKSIALQNNFSNEGATIMLVSPNLSNLSAGTHRLKFFAETWQTGTLQIGTIDNASSDGYFTLITTIELTAVNDEYTVDFSSYIGTDTFIAFKNTSPIPFSSIFLDDIRWELLPLCADVTNISVNQITPTTAGLTWTSNDNETQWEIVYSESSNNDPSILTPIAPAVNVLPETTINGLTANTVYNVWVRAVCGGTDGNGAWIGPETFSTSCTAVATFQEYFDTTEVGSIPSCWSTIVDGVVGFSAGVYIYNYGGYSGNNSMQLNSGNSDTNATIMLVSPNLSSLTTGSHRVKFYASGNSENQTLEIGTVDTPNATATFTNFQTISLIQAYQEYTVDFSGYTGTDTFIAFKHPSTSIYTSVFIDDVRWELTPLCEDIADLSATEVTTTSATFTWEPIGSETQWDIVYGPASITDPNAFTPVTPSVSGLSETTLSNLTPNTEYNIWVRSVCGGTDGNGAWIGPLKIHTPCIATAVVNEDFETTSFEEVPNCFSAFITGPTVDSSASVYGVEFNGNSGANAVQLYNGTSSGITDYVVLVLPNLSTLNTATHRLKFYARTDYGPGSLSVGTLNGSASTSTFTTFEEHKINENYSEFVVEFTSYTGTDTYVGIRNTSGDYTSVFVDDVRWEIAPLCADVADIESSTITTTSATIEWISQGSETQWDLVVGSSTDTDPTTLTPISPAPTNAPLTTLTGLTADTSYKVWVRSVCGGTDGNGVWMGPINFRTLCNSTTLPYIQNFETADVPNLPGCSVIENFSSGNVWKTAQVNSYGFNSKVMQYDYTCSSSANTWFYTQGINLAAGTTYKISYKYGSNSDFFVEKMKVAYGTSPEVGNMNNILVDHDNINFNVAATNEVTFTPANSDTYYFGFNAYSESCQYFLYVDDIMIDTNLSTGNIALEKATMYPNPVKDVLNISYNQIISNVKIYNILGQQMMEKAFNDTKMQMDLSALPSGHYLVKTLINDQVNTTKIVKE